MVNISKKKLKKEVSRQIHNSFIKTVSGLKGKSGSVFMEELLTPTEKVMLAKRLAALLMLAQNISPYKVSKLLSLSFTTTARMQDDIQNGEYPEILEIVRKKKEKEKFWAELEVLVRLGMPEMNKNRWKWLDDVFPKDKHPRN